MDGVLFDKEKAPHLAELLGLGFYRVTYEGQFVECDPNARDVFGIPQGNEIDLSKYSIRDFYVSPEERDCRISQLLECPNKFFCHTIPVHINGENKLLFDLYRHEDSYHDRGKYIGYVSNIEYVALFYKMFEHFPLGVYELDANKIILRVNRKFLDILGYKDDSDVHGRHAKTFFSDESEFDDYLYEVRKNGYANKILHLKHTENRIIEAECFSIKFRASKFNTWGMISDVSERELNSRLLTELPTAFFYIENDIVIKCNDQFAQILGFKNKEEVIGKVKTLELIASKQEEEQYINALNETFSNGQTLSKHRLKMIRVDNGEFIYISVDATVIKDKNGNPIGRMGTIHDITERVKIETNLKETEEKLKKTTADINRLTHTFMHPVIKFSGNSELLHQIGNALHQSFQREIPENFNHNEMSLRLMAELIRIKGELKVLTEKISESEKKDDLLISLDLEKQFTQIINVFDLTLNSKQSNFIKESALRDTALWVLDKLNASGYHRFPQLKILIPNNFIELLREILFFHLKNGAKLLSDETKIMKHGVETLRTNMLNLERKYAFVKRDFRTVLDRNIELFRPVFREENLGIDYMSPKGNLYAEMSESDIERVICNLMKNALKYSYKGQGRFIKVRAKELPHENQVVFFIENFGIPIKKDEIESGKIWEYGSRGELAYFSDREGSGIGLFDAREVILAHHGKIEITSNPAPGDWKNREYNVPYLTKVTVRIPKISKRTV